MAVANPLAQPTNIPAFLVGKSWYKWVATATVILGMMGSVLSSTMVNIAIPNIMGAYGIGQDEAHWMATAFFTTMPTFMLLNGWFVQSLGQRGAFLLAVSVFALASLVGQFMPDYYGLVVVRAVQGACAGLLQPLTMTVMFPLFPPEQRGRAMGIYGMGFILGPSFGPTVGGFIVDYLHWRDVFGCSIPLMFAAFVMGLTLPGRKPDAVRPKLNWISLASISSAMICFLVGISNAPRYGWDAPNVFGFLFFAACAFTTFIATEVTTKHPLLEVRLFAIRSFTISMLVAFIFGFGMFGSFYILPLFTQTVLDYTAIKAGMVMMLSGLIMVPIFPVGGRLAQSAPPGTPIVFGMALFAGTSFVLSGATIDSSFWFVVMWAAFGRIGLGVALPALQAGSLRDVPAELLAYGAGTLNFVRMTGAAIGTNGLALFLDNRLEYHADHLATTQTDTNSQTASVLAKVASLLESEGIGDAERMPLAMNYLGRMLSSQANDLAFQDGFVVLGTGFTLASLSALLLLKSTRR